MEATTATEPNISGNSTAWLNVDDTDGINARSIAAKRVTTYVSYKSAPIPAQSPTLSPTLSAMVAGFRGSSSGIPFSTFPTKSAPTSAALVKIPPPTLANSDTSDAPKPRPTNITGSLYKE